MSGSTILPFGLGRVKHFSDAGTSPPELLLISFVFVRFRGFSSYLFGLAGKSHETYEQERTRSGSAELFYELSKTRFFCKVLNARIYFEKIEAM